MTAGAAGPGGTSRRSTDAADLVLSAIHTTRQHAHAHAHAQRSAKTANRNKVKQVRAMILTVTWEIGEALVWCGRQTDRQTDRHGWRLEW